MEGCMDTTEELNGTYFYHGHANVAREELFWLIFLEIFSSRTGIAIETAAMILSGQPILPKPKGLGKSTSRTSITSKMARRIFKDRRFPENIRVATSVGFGNTRYTTKIGTVVGRAVPYLGYAQAVVIMMHVAKDTRNKYNMVARASDRIGWTYF